jgi:hypothetical protein
MELFSTFILIVIIFLIICWQFKVFVSNKTRIKDINGIFQNDESQDAVFYKFIAYIPKKLIESKELTTNNIGDYYNVFNNEDDDVDEKGHILVHKSDKEKITIIAQDGSSPILQSIVDSINLYLIKNKGAVSDFNLMKDVVERNCDAEVNILDTQTPLPLYTGLIGTMLGIIVGIGFIAFTSGFNFAANSTSHAIESLMTDVAIAMCASFCGILFTTITLNKSKSCKKELEEKKNEFYTWIQAEMLPAISGDTVSTFNTLTKSLSEFNVSFGENTKAMEHTMQKIESSLNTQKKTVELIKGIDINEFSQANINVLRELDISVNKLDKFNNYLTTVGDYLEAVQELSGKIDEHLDRTKAIEEMGKFFKTEFESIKQGTDKFEYASKTLNENVIEAFGMLKKTTEQLASQFNTYCNTIHDKAIGSIDTTQRTITGKLNSQQTVFNNNLEGFNKMIEDEEKRLSLTQRLEMTESIVNELKSIAPIKGSIDTLNDMTVQMNKSLNDMSASITALGNKLNNNPIAAAQVVTEGEKVDEEKPAQGSHKSVNILLCVIAGLLFLSLGFTGYSTYVTNKNVQSSIENFQNSIDSINASKKAVTVQPPASAASEPKDTAVAQANKAIN